MSTQPLDGSTETFALWGEDLEAASPAQQTPRTPLPARNNRRLQILGVAALVVAGVVAAAIGLMGGPSGAAPNGVAAIAPAAIVAAARNEVASVSSIGVRGSGEDAGRPVHLDLDLVSGQGGTGTITENGASFRLVVVGGAVYMKAPAASWQRAGAGAAGELLAGKWLQMSETGQFASVGSLANAPALFAKWLSLHGTLAKGPITTIQGQRVVEVQDPSNGGELFVAATGPPYPVEVTKPGAQGGTIIFDRFDQPVQLSIPPNAVDISQFVNQG